MQSTAANTTVSRLILYGT